MTDGAKYWPGGVQGLERLQWEVSRDSLLPTREYTFNFSFQEDYIFKYWPFLQAGWKKYAKVMWEGGGNRHKSRCGCGPPTPGERSMEQVQMA